MPAGDVTLDLALVPWASLVGSVVSVLSGEPVVGVKLVAGGDAFDRQALTDMLGGKGPTSDAAGKFVVGRVAPGKGTLAVLPAVGGFEKLAERPYEVKDGQRLDLGAIKIIPPRTGAAGTLGFATDPEGETLTISDVRAGGPAEGAGMKPGDRIVTINGVAVALLTPAIGQALLASGTVGVGQRFVLGLERAGSPLQVTVTAVAW